MMVDPCCSHRNLVYLVLSFDLCEIFYSCSHVVVVETPLGGRVFL